MPLSVGYLSSNEEINKTTLNKPSLSITQQAILGLTALTFFLWLALFVPAWTLNYWQAWVFWLVFVGCISGIGVFFLKKDLNLIASRLKVGPTAEQQANQKITQAVITVFFLLLFLVPSIDHHFQWYTIPSYLSLMSDGFVVLGLFVIFLVFKANSYTSVLVEVNEGQKVVSTGPYSIVRHPMYSGALVMLLFIPLALGSFWGLLAFPPILLAIAIRLNEEEKFLAQQLPGYSEYRQKVKYRLMPYVW
jgi:protein-S-isoprenylcysteine O-methyltransferase Ste14